MSTVAEKLWNCATTAADGRLLSDSGGGGGLKGCYMRAAGPSIPVVWYEGHEEDE